MESAQWYVLFWINIGSGIILRSISWTIKYDQQDKKDTDQRSQDELISDVILFTHEHITIALPTNIDKYSCSYWKGSLQVTLDYGYLKTCEPFYPPLYIGG